MERRVDGRTDGRTDGRIIGSEDEAGREGGGG
jgi:hypothetical protein